MPSLENYIQKIHKKLNNEGLEERKIKKYLEELDRLQITLDVLKSTGIGRAVNRLRKRGSDIGDIASSLVTKWKDLLKQDKDTKISPPDVDEKDLLASCGPTATESKVDLLNNKHHKSNHRNGEVNPKTRPTPQLCDVSFGCEPVNVKPKKKPSSSAGTATKLSSHDVRTDGLELPPLPSSFSVNNSLLPDIQPTYKPIRLPEFSDGSPKKHRGRVTGEVDELALMSRKSRTQVFSGRKVATTVTNVSSLFELSIKSLIENIDALSETGGVPYNILHPVLERCSPQQLLHLEECNPYFIDDTDPLWERHCCREFKGTKPKSGQSWRELYMQNESEREVRLKKIHAKISANQAAKTPERQIKLAYVESEAKPPREVLRKQARFGTGSRNHAGKHMAPPIARAPQGHQRNHSASPTKKHALPAPMMKKTMKLFKNQRSRAATSIKRR